MEVHKRAIATNDGETRTVTTTAKDMADLGFSTAQLDEASSMLISVYGQNILWYCDGTTPVVSGNRGHLLEADNFLVLSSQENVRKFQVIAVTGTATLTITLFKG